MGGETDLLIGGFMLYYTLLPDNYSSDDYARLYSEISVKLPSFRKEKAEKLIPSKERTENALSFFLLCHALSSEYPSLFSDMSLCDIGKTIFFSYSALGKPSLNPPYADIHFNISHCRTAIACAVAPFNIGVDIQDIRTPSSAVLKRFFPSSEQSVSADDFSVNWSRYEAFTKLTGEGITRSLTDCEYLSDNFLRRTHTFIQSFSIKDNAQKKTAAYLATAFHSDHSDSYLTSPIIIDFSSLCELALL